MIAERQKTFMLRLVNLSKLPKIGCSEGQMGTAPKMHAKLVAEYLRTESGIFLSISKVLSQSI